MPLDESTKVLLQGQTEYDIIPSGLNGSQFPNSASYGIASPKCLVI